MFELDQENIDLTDGTETRFDFSGQMDIAMPDQVFEGDANMEGN